MGTKTADKRKVEFEVVPDSIDGWDVTKKGGGQALSNHPSRETAEAAAELRGREEEADEVEVSVREDAVHELDDARQGMRTAFLALGGLLLAIIVLIAVISLIGSTTGFGS
jgi:hypothetical protein